MKEVIAGFFWKVCTSSAILAIIPKAHRTTLPQNRTALNMLALIPFDNPLSQRFFPESWRTVCPVVGLKPSPGNAAFFCATNPSINNGGNVYVNWTTQAAAMRALKLIMLGIAEQITYLLKYKCQSLQDIWVHLTLKPSRLGQVRRIGICLSCCCLSLGIWVIQPQPLSRRLWCRCSRIYENLVNLIVAWKEWPTSKQESRKTRCS